MSDSDRRAFLKKLAKTTAYSAPVIRTLAAPDPAFGQALSMKKGMGGGMGMGMGGGKGMDKGGGFMKGWGMFPDPTGMDGGFLMSEVGSMIGGFGMRGR